MKLGYHVTPVKDATAALSSEEMRAAEVDPRIFTHAILTTQELLAARRLPHSGLRPNARASSTAVPTLHRIARRWHT
jgi:hypothetical protein